MSEYNESSVSGVDTPAFEFKPLVIRTTELYTGGRTELGEVSTEETVLNATSLAANFLETGDGGKPLILDSDLVSRIANHVDRATNFWNKGLGAATTDQLVKIYREIISVDEPVEEKRKKIAASADCKLPTVLLGLALQEQAHVSGVKTNVYMIARRGSVHPHLVVEFPNQQETPGHFIDFRNVFDDPNDRIQDKSHSKVTDTPLDREKISAMVSGGGWEVIGLDATGLAKLDKNFLDA